MRNENKLPTAADLNAIYGARFYSGSDLGAQQPILTIDSVCVEDLRNKDGTEKKFVLHFVESTKVLALNKTNIRTLVKALGNDPAKWVGATIQLHADHEITFGGKPSLRLTVIKAPEPGLSGPDPDYIPFE